MTTKDQEPEGQEPEDPGTEGEGEPEGQHSGLTLESLDAKIDGLVRKVERAIRGSGGTRRAPSSEGNPDVAAQVREEVSKIAASEGRRKEREDRIGALETKIEKLAEKPPREYRRVTTILWGDDSDG